MNQATNVNIVPSYGQRGDLHFSQYDVGRTATINLYAVNEAYTIPVGATVKIQATKPSGLGFDVACTFSGSVVTVVSTETMTAEAGRFPAELHIIDNSDVIGTANFMFVVEASPHPDGVIDGDAEEVVNEIKALVLESEGFALGTQDGVPVDNTSPYWHNNSKYYSENVNFSAEFKQALLNCFSHVAWIDGDGQDYCDALSIAMNPQLVLVSISALYTQSGTVYTTDSLESLEADLVVTAHYDDSSEAEVAGYTLSGTLEVGTSTITVSYGGKTDTFNVTVSESFNYGIYTPDNVVQGKYIDDTGAIVDATQNSGYIDDYIHVVNSSYWISYTNARTYLGSGSLKSESNWRVSEYDADKTFIKQTHYSTSNSTEYCAREVSFEANTEYIRLGWYNSDSTNVGVFEIENPDDITDLSMEVGDINSSTGQNATSSGNVRLRTTGYVPASDTITMTGCPFADSWSSWGANAGFAFRCYGSDYGFLGSLTNSGGLFNSDISSVALPAGTAYVRMFCQNSGTVALTQFAYLTKKLITINGTDYYVVG